MNRYWQTTVTADGWQTLPADCKVDIAVVGGGYTGLSTAHSLSQAVPTAQMIVLESGRVGQCASALNAGFARSLLGLTNGITAPHYGKAQTRRAHLFMECALDNVAKLVRDDRIDCDYERTELLTMAHTPAQICGLRHEVRLAQQLGLEGITWLDGPTTRGRVGSPHCLGARFEEHCAMLNPAKLLQGLRKRAKAAGVVVYEHAPTRVFAPGTNCKRHRLLTPSGVVSAERVVFVSNAYNHQFPALSGKTYPVYSYGAVTEPLSDEQLATIGWSGRQGIEDGHKLIPYYRLTADNRLLMGGEETSIQYAAAQPREVLTDGNTGLDRLISAVFPDLFGARIAERWDGTVLTPRDAASSLGYLGSDPRVVYSLGWSSHDVAFPIYMGQLLTALTLDLPHVDRDLVFVNRRALALPPEPIRFASSPVL